MAVLSLLGPGLADQAVLDVLGLDALPAEAIAVPLGWRRLRAPDAWRSLPAKLSWTCWCRVTSPPTGGTA